MRISDWSSDVCSSDLQRRQIDRVGEGDAVEDRGGVVADPEHQAAQAAFGLGQAILAMFMRIARRAGDERERAACQADEVAIADVDRGQGELIAAIAPALRDEEARSEEHTSELQSLMRISYAVFCLKKKTYKRQK